MKLGKEIFVIVILCIVFAFFVTYGPMKSIFFGKEISDTPELQYSNNNLNASNDTVNYSIMPASLGRNIVFVDYSQTKRVSFTAPGSGTYVFTTIGETDTYGCIYSSSTSSNEIDSDDDGGNDRNFRLEKTLSSNETVYIGVKFYQTDLSGSITLNISKLSTPTPTPTTPPPSIQTVGMGNYTLFVGAGNMVRAKFTALSSGTYVFTTVGLDDTQGYIFSSATSSNEIVFDDDGGADRNFRLQRSLSANETIYIGIKYYQAVVSGNVTLNISKLTAPTPRPATPTPKATKRSYSPGPYEKDQYYKAAAGKQNAEAFDYYKKSAAAGYAMGQYQLAECYTNGWGCDKDYDRAFSNYRKSAQQGNSMAQAALGRAYLQGRGTSKDYDEAVYWLELSCEQDDDLGQLWLGYCYQNGYGVKKNKERAAYYYELSAAQGNANAKKRLKDL